jgi:hypothetical protein
MSATLVKKKPAKESEPRKGQSGLRRGVGYLSPKEGISLFGALVESDPRLYLSVTKEGHDSIVGLGKPGGNGRDAKARGPHFHR